MRERRGSVGVTGGASSSRALDVAYKRPKIRGHDGVRTYDKCNERETVRGSVALSRPVAGTRLSQLCNYKFSNVNNDDWSKKK